MGPALKEVGEEAKRLRESVETKSDAIRLIVRRIENWIREDLSGAEETKILVLDDNELVGRAFVRLARDRSGVKVDHVRNVEEGVTAISRTSYDGCVVDLGVNGLGTTFCQHIRLRSMRPLIPIVVYTGEVDDFLAQRAAQRCGANRAILKSKHSVEETLATLVEMCMAQRDLEK